MLLLRTGDETHEMFGLYQDCAYKGFDDGFAVREVTREACAPLFGERVIVTAHSAAFHRCLARE